VSTHAPFRDAQGNPSDPASVTLTVRRPDGSMFAPAVTRTGTGQYTATVDLDQAGTWRYEWQTTGTPQLVEGGDFYVHPRRT
jgi:uncharacterized protein YfaS (alpha-2-macroglobulin family)